MGVSSSWRHCQFNHKGLTSPISSNLQLDRFVSASDLFGLDWTGFEDRSSPVLWKPDLDPGAPWSSSLPAKPNAVSLGNIIVLRIKSRGSKLYQIIVYITLIDIRKPPLHLTALLFLILHLTVVLNSLLLFLS